MEDLQSRKILYNELRTEISPSTTSEAWQGKIAADTVSTVRTTIETATLVFAIGPRKSGSPEYRYPCKFASHRPWKNARIRSFSTGSVSSMADMTILTITADEKFLNVLRKQLQHA